MLWWMLGFLLLHVEYVPLPTPPSVLLFHRCYSSIGLILPSVLLFHWCYSSIGVLLPSVLLFHRCYSSIGLILPSVLLFHWCYSSIGVTLPSVLLFHRCYSSIGVILPSVLGPLLFFIRYFFNLFVKFELLTAGLFSSDSPFSDRISVR